MATYATISDFEGTIEGWVTDDAAALERIIERAERDVDRVLGPLRRDPNTGLKVDPTNLTAPDRAALARAVSRQAHHRITALGEGLSGEPARVASKISGPDFTVEYADSAAAAVAATATIGPGVAGELEPLAWMRPRGARARP